MSSPHPKRIWRLYVCPEGKDAKRGGASYYATLKDAKRAATGYPVPGFVVSIEAYQPVMAGPTKRPAGGSNV